MRRAVVAALLSALAIAAIGQGAAADAPAKPAGSAAAKPAGAAAARSAAAVVDLSAIKQLMSKSRGRALVVHFWATWCIPCLNELPLVNKFAGDMKARGVDVLSLSLDDPETSLPRVAALLGKSAPNLTATVVKVDDADVFIASFDREWEGAIPAMFAFDPQGTLRARHFGEATRAHLDRLVNEATRNGAGAKR